MWPKICSSEKAEDKPRVQWASYDEETNMARIKVGFTNAKAAERFTIRLARTKLHETTE